MTKEITPLAETGIHFFNLVQSEETHVSTCVQRYSHVPDGIIEKVEQIAFQVLEELKHILSESDWDRAAAMLSERTYDAAPYTVKFFLKKDRFKPMGKISLQALVYANKTSIPLPKVATKSITIDRVAFLIDELVITFIKAL